MKKAYIMRNAAQTRKLGELLAEKLRGGEIICLTGELGSGKTTFTQGVLRGLKIKGPYTSPTFVIVKRYKIKKRYQIPDTKYQILNIYHVDVYRVGAKDILELGWEEIIGDKNNVVIIEWAEKIKEIIPKKAVWVRFRHKGNKEREISICKNFKFSI